LKPDERLVTTVSASSQSVADSAIVRLAVRFGVDRAVVYAVMTRVWQVLTGPVSQLLLILFVPASARDYYFAFTSMLGLQIFIELGLHVVIINLASHEWAKLRLEDGRLAGDETAKWRLISLGRMMNRWYAWAAGIFLLFLAVSGWLFFDSAEQARQEISASGRGLILWSGPWLALAALTSLQLTLLPGLSILEGCHQVANLYRTRFWQAIAGTISVWLCLVSGLELWALVVSAAVRLAGDFYLVRIRYRAFFEDFRAIPQTTAAVIGWKQEILPLQWRIAVQGFIFWLAVQLPLLFVFRSRDEGDAARLGMTWTVLTAAQGAALAWVETRRPMFGSLIAERKFARLDELFFRVSGISMVLITVAAGALSLIVWFVNSSDVPLAMSIADSLLPPWAAVMLSMGFVSQQVSQCVNLYVRAHNRDPFLFASTLSNLTVAGLQLGLGWKFGVTGVAAGYLLGVSVVQSPILTLIWWRARRDWH
jgi:hypothetical protein